MDAPPSGGLYTGLVPLETVTSSQSQALPLPASLAEDLRISAAVVLAAVLIDSILILILVALLSRIFGTAGIFVAYVFGLLYYVLLTTLQGQTLGKMFLGIQVVDSRGSIPTVGTVLLREVVGRFISGLLFNLGYIWVAWDREKRAWHDHIAGTFVIRKERERVL